MYEYMAHEYIDDLGFREVFSPGKEAEFVARMLNEFGKDGWRLSEWNREECVVLLERELKDRWRQPEGL